MSADRFSTSSAITQCSRFDRLAVPDAWNNALVETKALHALSPRNPSPRPR